MEEFPKIIAKSVDLKHIKVKCCFCGRIHSHGSNKDISNREEHRVADCGNGDSYIIIINDNTKKNEVPFHIRYAETIQNHRGEKFNKYTRDRYYKKNQEKMVNNMIKTIDNHPELLQKLCQHYLLQAINEN